MVAGYYNPAGHPVMDFFDPVSFDIINNGGKDVKKNMKNTKLNVLQIKKRIFQKV